MGYELDLDDGRTIELPDWAADLPQTKLDAIKARAIASDDGDIEIDLQDSPSLGQIPGLMKENFYPSAVQFAKDSTALFREPIQTAEGIGKLIVGAVSKATGLGSEYEENAEAVGEFFADRYGGWDEIKNTIATDPVGALADLSLALTAGGSAVARGPSAIGKLGAISKKVGKAVDPMNMAAKGAGLGVDAIGGLGTHTGGESIRGAFKAGFDDPGIPGVQSKRPGAGAAFRSEMDAPTMRPVQEAREAVDAIRRARAQQYNEKLSVMRRGTETIKVKDLLDDFDKTVAGFSRNGRLPAKVNDLAPKMRKVIEGHLEKLPDGTYDFDTVKTPYELDLLKQDLWDIQSKYLGKRDSRYNLANQVRRNVRNKIAQKAPIYDGMMKDWGKASDLINEMERTLSLNPKATIDTSLRKLQSIFRNNANTSYQYRLDLGKLLQENGAEFLFDRLSGQAMSSLTARGLGKGVMGMSGVGGVAFNPALLATLPLQSPKVVGSAAHYAGRGAGAARYIFGKMPGSAAAAKNMSAIPQGFFQTGRAADISNEPDDEAY